MVETVEFTVSKRLVGAKAMFVTAVVPLFY
jgi:hypothetical protein